MPKGFPVRDQLAPEARRLRAQGLTYREISERLGVPKSTISEWVLDPDRSQHAARRAEYAGECENCGAPTDGSAGPGRAPSVCRECSEWSDEAIIEAMRAWVAKYGRQPRSGEWRNSSNENPCAKVVEDRFGWNEALLKAGFTLACDRRPEVQADLERIIRGGATCREAGAHYGLSAATVAQRLRYRGLSVTALRNGKLAA